jgi:hypothetical protein
MTDDPPTKKSRPDPFAPLPLDESLTGKRAAPVFVEPPPTDAATPVPVAAFDPVQDAPQEFAEPQAPVASEPVEPILPATYDENDLRAAVGATQVDDAVSRKAPRAPTDDGDDGDRDKPRSRKAMVVGALALVVGAGITAVVLLGRVNSARYIVACEADRVVVQQGRSFPPWGESALDGAEWRPLKIPPEAPCATRETEDKAELAGWYGKMLEDQATTLLTAREVNKVDEAEADLKQALLVARSLGTDDARIDTRERIERLLGDVAYWRASARLRTAAEALADAAKQFDAAALQKPRYVTDAAAWATYVRKLVDDLHVGPAGVNAAVFPPSPPSSERPSAPPGVALPVEPDAGSGSAVPEPEPTPAPDAGLPTGGVLL